uniref:Acylglycerol kinase, mitochondrial n=1 Tax=Ixodes ricinus TaxID=34613 RepID=V5HWL8_IXORI
MNRVIAVCKTLRNHWKKSTFAACLIAYGGWYLDDRHRTNLMMRAFCEHAKAYGDEPLPAGAKPRHITVIINPTAKDGKGKILYEKYAAPLFHLAGIRVSYFTTEYAGQAKSLMEVLENTDAVVIAGGDGTLHEAVTGIMSRSDYATACKRYPMGVIPAGKTNAVAKQLFWEPGMNEARWIASSAMAIVKEQLSMLDVAQVELRQEETAKGEEGPDDVSHPQVPVEVNGPQVVYALGRLEQGAFRDARSTIPKYWYFGALRTRAAFFFNALKELPEATAASLSYVEPCTGCSRCFVDEVGTRRAERRRWWSSFMPRSAPQASEPRTDYSKVTNPDCGIQRHSVLGHCQLDVSANSKKDLHALKLSVSPPSSGRLQFFSECMQRQAGSHKSLALRELLARELNLEFQSGTKKENGTGSQGTARTVSVDSVEYQAQKVYLKLIPRVLHVYSAVNS